MKKINNFWYTDKQYIEILEKRINKAIKILESKKHCERLCGGIDGKTFTEQAIDILKGEKNES